MFENLTLVPYETSLIINSMLTQIEKNWINKYHKKVFQNLKGFMNKVEMPELKKSCSAI